MLPHANVMLILFYRYGSSPSLPPFSISLGIIHEPKKRQNTSLRSTYWFIRGIADTLL